MIVLSQQDLQGANAQDSTSSGEFRGEDRTAALHLTQHHEASFPKKVTRILEPALVVFERNVGLIYPLGLATDGPGKEFRICHLEVIRQAVPIWRWCQGLE